MNSDAVANLHHNRSGLSMVIHDCFGQVLMAAATCSSVCFSPLVLEAIALKRGLELALDAGCSKLVVDSDSSTLVKAINSYVFPLSETDNLVRDIAVLIRNKVFLVSLLFLEKLIRLPMLWLSLVLV
ncbi:hypothetical protein ACOSP7_018016 [Xanthoceras sorbifolium]